MGAQGYGALAGAGLGVIQHNQNKAEYNRQKQLAADTARWSPWTGMQAKMPGSAPSLLGDVAGGALSGASFGQQLGGAGGSTPAAAPTAAPAAAQGFNPQGNSNWQSLMATPQAGNFKNPSYMQQQQPATLYSPAPAYTMIG